MAYPIRIEVDYQQEHSRLTTFFRYFMLIPQMIILYFVGIVASILMMVLWVVIVVTGKSHEDMFAFIAKFLRWQTRVNAYAMLLTDVHPPFSGEADAASYPVRVEIDDSPEDRNRLTVLLRYFWMIPAVLVASLVGFAAGIVSMVMWFVIVITGKSPQGMHEFVARTLRWQTRVNAYSMLLTDEYPPFSGDA
jgi:hypothetical protein